MHGGKESYVKDFALSCQPFLYFNNERFCSCDVDFNNDFFAEAWAASHKNGVSGVCSKNGEFVFLDDLIAGHPFEMLGHNANLNVLAKVLSVDKPLSIQAHPSAQKAKELHILDSSQYDSNPKPEALIALTDVELLCGFCKPTKILNSIKSIEQFKSLFSANDMSLLESMCVDGKEELFLKFVCRQVLSDEELACKLSVSLYNDIEKKKKRSNEEEWIYNIRQLYPHGDVGIFFFYILNLLTLKSGQCMFIESGKLHAYLSGQLLECMCNSDNTLRAGLTDKPKDVDALIDVADFSVSDSFVVETSIRENGSKEFIFPNDSFFRVFELSAGKDSLGNSIPCQFVCENESLEFLLILNGIGYIEFNSEFSQSLIFKTPSMFIVPACIKKYCINITKGYVYRIGML